MCGRVFVWRQVEEFPLASSECVYAAAAAASELVFKGTLGSHFHYVPRRAAAR